MTLPAYVTAHKGDTLLKYYWLIEIQSSPVQRLTMADQSIWYGGVEYTASRSLVLESLSANEADRDVIKMNVRIGNADAAFGILVSGFIGASRSPAAVVYEVWLDAAAENVVVTPGNGYALISGRVDSPSWDSEWVSFSVVPVLDGTAEKVPSLIYGTTCVHRRFKGTGCGYVGAATSCNRSRAACAALGNTDRFLAFPELPPDDKEFTLGFNGSASIKPRKRS